MYDTQGWQKLIFIAMAFTSGSTNVDDNTGNSLLNT